MRELKIKGIYRHHKGDFYLVEDIIYHSETHEKMVAYRALYGDNKLWCKPYDMFMDEVNKNGQKYRFELQEIKSVKDEKQSTVNEKNFKVVMKKGRSVYNIQINCDPGVVNGLIQSYLQANNSQLYKKTDLFFIYLFFTLLHKD